MKILILLIISIFTGFVCWCLFDIITTAIRLINKYFNKNAIYDSLQISLCIVYTLIGLIIGLLKYTSKILIYLTNCL